MRDLKYEVLKLARYHIVDEGEICEDSFESLIKSFVKILKASEISRKEGLLALEEYANNDLNVDDAFERFFKDIVLLIIDGTDPEVIDDVAENEILLDGVKTYEGYHKYCIYRGLRMVQEGYNPRIVLFHLLTLVPRELRDNATALISEPGEEYQTTRNKEFVNNWQSLKVMKTNNPFLQVFENKLSGYDDATIKRFITVQNIRQFGNVLCFVSQELKDRVTALMPLSCKANIGEWAPFYNESSLGDALVYMMGEMMEFDDDIPTTTKRRDRISLDLTEEEINDLFN